MARCPYCDEDISEWVKEIREAPPMDAPQVWTCPDCDAVLGFSDWGSYQR
jgi:uncharacterized protein with PIN domain